jgi:hypothetical protein
MRPRRAVDDAQVRVGTQPVAGLREHRGRRVGTDHAAADGRVLRERGSGAAADVQDDPLRSGWAQPTRCRAEGCVERLDDKVVEPRLDRVGIGHRTHPHLTTIVPHVGRWPGGGGAPLSGSPPTLGRRGN